MVAFRVQPDRDRVGTKCVLSGECHDDNLEGNEGNRRLVQPTRSTEHRCDDPPLAAPAESPGGYRLGESARCTPRIDLI